MGNAKVYIQNGMQRESNEVNWHVDYDGDDADIDVDIGHNGKKTRYKAVLSNEDLANLLNMPSVNMPLENRLQNDFLVDKRVYKLEPISFKQPRQIQPPMRRYRPIRILRTRKYKRRPISRKITARPKTMRIRLNERRGSSSPKYSSQRRFSARTRRSY